MGEEYKLQITERIKDSINKWIEELKSNHQELLLTKQWNVLFPKGVVSGHNVIPVVTGSKNGKHLVGEVQFKLPDNLELDLDAIELILKNEPYKKESEKKKTASPVPLDEPLDVLNELIVSVNQFLQGFNVPDIKNTNPVRPLFHQGSKPIFNQKTIPLQNMKGIESVRREIAQSPYLPEWLKTIDSYEIREELI
ncbi:MAG: hypothetical protein ACTSRU_20835, partial [Candidatus Hodarchaeales archaeon]